MHEQSVSSELVDKILDIFVTVFINKEIDALSEQRYNLTPNKEEDQKDAD